VIPIVVNGRVHEMPDGATVADVVTAVGHDAAARGIAVARNGEVVRRSEWTTTNVEAADRIEVLTAVQGG
jgi:sulfur carrier protein